MLTAVVVPGVQLYSKTFSLSRILFPGLTSAKIPIRFARLNSNINYSVKKILRLSAELGISFSECLWYLLCSSVFIFLILLNKYFSCQSLLMGEFHWDQRQCYSFLYPWLMVYYLQVNRCSTNKYESGCWMNWSDLVPTMVLLASIGAFWRLLVKAVSLIKGWTARGQNPLGCLPGSQLVFCIPFVVGSGISKNSIKRYFIPVPCFLDFLSLRSNGNICQEIFWFSGFEAHLPLTFVSVFLSRKHICQVTYIVIGKLNQWSDEQFTLQKSLQSLVTKKVFVEVDFWARSWMISMVSVCSFNWEILIWCAPFCPRLWRYKNDSVRSILVLLLLLSHFSHLRLCVTP